MAVVAEWFRRRVVIPVYAGSIPVDRPTISARRSPGDPIFAANHIPDCSGPRKEGPFHV